MKSHPLKSGVVSVLAISFAAFSTEATYAEPAVGASISAELTPAAVTVLVPTGMLLHEGVKALNGQKPFGANGEGMKVLHAPISILAANAQAAERETGDLAQATRAVTGVSFRDIEKHGVLGGRHSFLRRPFG